MVVVLFLVEYFVFVLQLLGEINCVCFLEVCDWCDFMVNDVLFVVMLVVVDYLLWIFYLFGIIGMFKFIVYGYGGLLLVQMMMGVLYFDLGFDDVYYWYSSIGWVMWNLQVSGLFGGVMFVIYDGNFGMFDFNMLWCFVQDVGVMFFGVGVVFFVNCLKVGIELGCDFDLLKLCVVGFIGLLFLVEVYDWIYCYVKVDVWFNLIFGGIDFVGCFVGGVVMLFVYVGEM